MKRDIVIIGGGVAGLCAAIQLGHLGVSSLVIEAGGYPAHKVCGEFLSPETLPLLHKWGIEPLCIKKACFFTTQQALDFTFKQPAGGLSHLCLDPALLRYAKSLGAEVITHVKVEALDPKQTQDQAHLLRLSDGQMIQANSLIFAVGRIPCLEHTPQIRYMGIKAHFKGIELGQTLHMFGFKGAYLGISTLEEGKSNLACLADIKRVQQAGSVQNFMNILHKENARFKELMSSGAALFDWMTTYVPTFGFRNNPKWLDAYFIGDAALSVPPVCGGGLSLAMTSGMLVAKYVLQRDFLAFRKIIKTHYSHPLRVAKMLHYCLMRPQISRMILKGCSIYPAMAQSLFRSTRPGNLNLHAESSHFFSRQ